MSLASRAPRLVTFVAGTCAALVANVAPAVIRALPSHAAAGSPSPSLRLEGIDITAPGPNAGRSVGAQVNGARLDAFGADDLADMAPWLPGLNFAYVDPRQANIAVRGIGNNPVNESTHGSVPVYLDGVYLGRQGMAVGNLVDLASVNLLRGPQGVIYGENASGGALDIRTRAPTFTPQLRFSAGAGNRGIYKLSGDVSGPLTRQLAGRLTAWRTHDDGWLTNRYDGERLDGIDRSGVRGQLLLAGASRWQVRAIADYSVEADRQGALVVTGVGPAPSGYRNLNQATDAAGVPRVPTRAKDYAVSNNIDQAINTHQGGVTLKADADFGWATLASTTGWRTWRYSPHEDFDHSAADIYRDLGYRVHHRQWSQEFRLASPLHQRVDWLLGAGFYHEKVSSRFDLQFGDDADTALLPFPFNSLPGSGALLPPPLNRLPLDQLRLITVLDGINSRLTGSGATDSAYLYGRFKWHATRHLALVAGSRVSYDRIRGRSTRAPYTGVAPSLLPLINDVRQTLVGPADSGSLQRHDASVAGVLEARLHWNSGMLAYLRASTNQKPGGFNLAGAGITRVNGVDPLRFSPERARAVELGIEHHAGDVPFYARLDVFLERIHGYQASEVLVSKQSFGNTPVGVLTNVGEVGTSGVEWAVSGTPFVGLRLGFNGAYTDARYRDFDNAPCSAEHNPGAPPACDLSGRRVANSPVWMMNGWARYRWHWSQRWSQGVQISYAWRSGVYGTLDDSRYARLPAYGLLDAGTALRWQRGRQHVTLRLWGRNLGNLHYFTGGGALAVGYAYAAAAGPSRSFGATLVYGLD